MESNTKRQLTDDELQWLHKKLEKGEPYKDGEEPPVLYDVEESPEISARREATYAQRMLKKYGYL